MKTNAYCDSCRKVVKVKVMHFAGFNCNIYLACGHDIHLVFAYRSTPDHDILGKQGFEKVKDPLASHFP